MKALYKASKTGVLFIELKVSSLICQNFYMTNVTLLLYSLKTGLKTKRLKPLFLNSGKIFDSF